MFTRKSRKTQNFNFIAFVFQNTTVYYARLAKLPLQSNAFNLQARGVIRCNQDETAMILGYDEVIRYYARLLIVVHLYKTEMDIFLNEQMAETQLIAIV